MTRRLAWCALLSGFFVSWMFARQAQVSIDATALARRTVIALPPKIVVEQSGGKSHIGDLDAIESALASHAASELKTRQYTLVSPQALENNPAFEPLKQLQPLSGRLVRGAFNEEVQELLSHLDGLPQDSLILVQFARIKEGPGGSWNPINGAITSGMSSTLLQAALISPHKATVVWKGELLERKVLGADDPKLEKDLALLYKTLAN